MDDLKQGDSIEWYNGRGLMMEDVSRASGYRLIENPAQLPEFRPGARALIIDGPKSLYGIDEWRETYGPDHDHEYEFSVLGYECFIQGRAFYQYGKKIKVFIPCNKIPQAWVNKAPVAPNIKLRPEIEPKIVELFQELWGDGTDREVEVALRDLAWSIGAVGVSQWIENHRNAPGI
jgi:hypothetical protein